MVYRRFTIYDLIEVVCGLGLKERHAPFLGLSFHVSENLFATVKVSMIPPFDCDQSEPADTPGAVADAQAHVARPAPRLALVNGAWRLPQRTGDGQ